MVGYMRGLTCIYTRMNRCGDHHQTGRARPRISIPCFGMRPPACTRRAYMGESIQGVSRLLRLDRFGVVMVFTEESCFGNVTASGTPCTHLYTVLCNYSISLCIKQKPSRRSKQSTKPSAQWRFAENSAKNDSVRANPVRELGHEEGLSGAAAAKPNLKLGSAGFRTY